MAVPSIQRRWWSLLLLVLPIVAAAQLNDTGQGTCYAGSGPVIACTGATGEAATHPGQDARFGRDAKAAAGALAKTGAGAAGFDFTAIDTAGAVTAPGGHACVHDHVTGLFWSTQTSTGTWTDVVAQARSHQACGFPGGWRVPTRRELLSLVHHGRHDPAIDATFFPATSGAYWSSDTQASTPANAWIVDFADGSTGGRSKGSAQGVRFVVNGNRSPSFSKGPDQAVPQNAVAQTVTPWATDIDDGDGGTQALHFVVGTDNDALFTVPPAVAANGTLTFTTAPATTGSAHVTVTLVDDGGTAYGGSDTSAPQTFLIRVVPANQPPSFSKGPDQTVGENAGAQAVTGWATNIDDGDGGTEALSFTVTTDNAALFAVPPAVAANGTLTYTPAADALGEATVKVVLVDNDGTGRGPTMSLPQTFVIRVVHVNQAPSFTAGADLVLNPTQRPGATSIAGWATNFSPGPASESGQTLTATVRLLPVQGQKALAFDTAPALDVATGTLSFTIKHTIYDCSSTPPFWPFCGDPAYADSQDAATWVSSTGLATVEITLQDNGGTAAGGVDKVVKTFTIFLDPKPVATDTTVRHPWKSPCVPITLGGWDADSDPGEEWTYPPWKWPRVIITTAPTRGFLTQYISRPNAAAPSSRAQAADEGLGLTTTIASGGIWAWYGSLCYIPFTSTFTGTDSFTYALVDNDGNVSDKHFSAPFFGGDGSIQSGSARVNIDIFVPAAKTGAPAASTGSGEKQ